jgi:hypothetical protein
VVSHHTLEVVPETGAPLRRGGLNPPARALREAEKPEKIQLVVDGLRAPYSGFRHDGVDEVDVVGIHHHLHPNCRDGPRHQPAAPRDALPRLLELLSMPHRYLHFL